MVKLSSNPTCVLSDADVLTNEQAERIAKVLTRHLPGANNVTEAGKIIGVNADGDVSLVEDKTGSTYTAGTGLTLADGEFSVDNPLPGASGASQGDVLTVGSNGPEWAPQSVGYTTASGHFDLAGSVPVKVNYTGTQPMVGVPPSTQETQKTCFPLPENASSLKLYVPERILWGGFDVLCAYKDINGNNVGSYFLINGAVTIEGSTPYFEAGTYDLPAPTTGGNPAVTFYMENGAVNLHDTDSWRLQYPSGSVETTIPSIPDTTGASQGDVLTVGSDGPEWAAPSGGTEYSAGDGISIANDTISAKVDGTTIQVNASGELEAIGGGGSSASGYFVPFYSSYTEMLDTTVINSYGTHIDGVVGTRLTQHWYPGAISQISINLPARMGPANDIYKATLSILLEDTNDASNTVYLVRNTENTGVGLGDIPPNYSYGNLSFNFTIGPRDLPYNYSIKELTFRIEDVTNSSQTMTMPTWISLDEEMVERWSRNTAGIMLTQVPASITNV